MMRHNPKAPLLASFVLLAISVVGAFLEGMWFIGAFILGVVIQFALLFKSDARIEDKVDVVEHEVQGLIDREAARRDAPEMTR